MSTRLLISLPVGLGTVVILVALQISEAIAVGIGIGSGAFVGVLMDSRNDHRLAWGGNSSTAWHSGYAPPLLMAWLR